MHYSAILSRLAISFTNARCTFHFAAGHSFHEYTLCQIKLTTIAVCALLSYHRCRVHDGMRLKCNMSENKISSLSDFVSFYIYIRIYKKIMRWSKSPITYINILFSACSPSFSRTHCAEIRVFSWKHRAPFLYLSRRFNLCPPEIISEYF